MDSEKIWYLKKAEDHTIYGPATLEELKEWCTSAKIAPLDKVSNDGKKNWVHAPTIRELHMDWLLEVSDDYLYGPTTLGTIHEFLMAGEITVHAYMINCREGKRSQIKENPLLQNMPTPSHIEAEFSKNNLIAPIGNDPQANPKKKLSNLQKLILQLRNDLRKCEERYQHLRQQYIKDTGKEPT